MVFLVVMPFHLSSPQTHELNFFAPILASCLSVWMYHRLQELFRAVQGGFCVRRQNCQGVALEEDDLRLAHIALLDIFDKYKSTDYPTEFGVQKCRPLFDQLVEEFQAAIPFAAGFGCGHAVKFCIIVGLLQVPKEVAQCAHIAKGTKSYEKLTKVHHVEHKDVAVYLAAVSHGIGGSTIVGAENLNCETTRNLNLNNKGEPDSSEQLEEVFPGMAMGELVMAKDGVPAHHCYYLPKWDDEKQRLVLGDAMEVKQFSNWVKNWRNEPRAKVCPYLKTRKLKGQFPTSRKLTDAVYVGGKRFRLDPHHIISLKKLFSTELDFKKCGQELHRLMDVPGVKERQINQSYHTKLKDAFVEPSEKWDYLREETEKCRGHNASVSKGRSLPLNGRGIFDCSVEDVPVLPREKIKLQKKWEHKSPINTGIPAHMECIPLAARALKAFQPVVTQFRRPKLHLQLYSTRGGAKIMANWDEDVGGPYVAEFVEPDADRCEAFKNKIYMNARNAFSKAAKKRNEQLLFNLEIEVGAYAEEETRDMELGAYAEEGKRDMELGGNPEMAETSAQELIIYDPEAVSREQISVDTEMWIGQKAGRSVAATVAELQQGGERNQLVAHLGEQMGGTRGMVGFQFNTKQDAWRYAVLCVALFDNGDNPKINKSRQLWVKHLKEAARRQEGDSSYKVDKHIDSIAVHRHELDKNDRHNRQKLNQGALFYVVFPHTRSDDTVYLGFYLDGKTYLYDFVRPVGETAITRPPKEVHMPRTGPSKRTKRRQRAAKAKAEQAKERAEKEKKKLKEQKQKRVIEKSQEQMKAKAEQAKEIAQQEKKKEQNKNKHTQKTKEQMKRKRCQKGNTKNTRRNTKG